MEDIYKINVSGKTYDIKYKHLETIPYFHEYINECHNNINNQCFVDRSPMIFDHVLAYVIDPLHPYPQKYFYELAYVMDNNHPVECSEELKYYGIIYNYRLTKTDIHNIENYVKNNESYLIDIRNKLDDINTKLASNENIKLCKYDGCENHTIEYREYCYDHGECLHCYADATRDNNFYCNLHS